MAGDISDRVHELVARIVNIENWIRENFPPKPQEEPKPTITQAEALAAAQKEQPAEEETHSSRRRR